MEGSGRITSGRASIPRRGRGLRTFLTEPRIADLPPFRPLEARAEARAADFLDAFTLLREAAGRRLGGGLRIIG
jgi:hypothetical protein